MTPPTSPTSLTSDWATVTIRTEKPPSNSPRAWERAAAAWSFAEACLWFIVPDVFLFASGVAQPKRARRRVLIALLFSLLGTVAMWELCRRYRLEALLFSLPLTYPAMAVRVQELDSLWGQVGAVLQAWSLIPVKVWTWTAVERLDWRLDLFLFWVGLSRAARMLLFTWLGCRLGRRFPNLRSRAWALAYGLVVLPVLYLSAAPFR